MSIIKKVKRALQRIRERIEERLSKGHPYVVISLRWIKRELELKRPTTIDILIYKLKGEYKVGKNGTWLLIEQ